jgi:hypothetical protein
MSAGDLGGDVKSEAKPLSASLGDPRKKGWNNRSIVAGGIGSPALATEGSN